MRLDVFLQLLSIISIIMGGIMVAANLLWKTAQLINGMQFIQDNHEERLDVVEGKIDSHEERITRGGL